MFPDLYFLLKYLFEVEILYFHNIKTFGFFLSISFLVNFIIFIYEVKRKEKNGILLPVKILNRKYFVSEKINYIILAIFISALLGGKLFSIVKSLFFLDHLPLNYFLITNESIYCGGLIFGFIAGWLLCKFYKLSFLKLFDTISPPLMLSYAIGRLDCHLFGGGDWGVINPLPKPSWWFLPKSFWSFDYPHNVINYGIPIENYNGLYSHLLMPSVIPISLYEFFIAILFSIILFLLSKKFDKIESKMFSLFLIFMSFERFIIEFVRVNPKYSILGLYIL